MRLSLRFLVPLLLVMAAFAYADSASIEAGSEEVLLLGHHPNLEVGMRIAFFEPPFSQVVTITRLTRLSLPGWTDSPSASLLPEQHQRRGPEQSSR